MAQWTDVPVGDWVGHTQSVDAKVTRSVTDPVMLDALAPRGESVLDIGCGEGYFARALREAGAAHVAGLDISPDFIAEARARDPEGEYHVHDISSGPFFEDASFDAVGSSMVLMYPEDLDRTYANISRILRPSGRMVASITNPYYAFPVGDWGWGLRDGLYRGFDPRHRSWRDVVRQFEGVLRSRFDFVLYIRNYFERRTVGKTLSGADVLHVHRPFSDYLNLATKHGLRFEAMWEPQISPELLARYPDEPIARALVDVPLIFVLKFVKDGPHA
jgi:SAM-dependent methyltransferase